MKNFTRLFVALCVCVSFLNAKHHEISYPFAISSSESLDDKSLSMFSDYQNLIDNYFDGFYFKNNALPKKNIFYLISTPYNSIMTLKFISENKHRYINIMDLLKNKKNTFTSKYLEYSSSEIESYIKGKYQNTSSETLEIYEHDCNAEDFKQRHDSLLNSSNSTLEIINFDLLSLQPLNVLAYQDLKNLSKISPDSFSIFIGFKPLKNEDYRILLEETATETTVDTTTSTSETETVSNSTQNSTVGDSLRVKPYTVSGYFFSLLALFVVLVGGVTLCSVQTPDKFPRYPLLVGRESN